MSDPKLKKEGIVISSKEKMIFWVLIIAFALMGLTKGFTGLVAFTGLGLIIWLIWRGRKL